MSIRHPVWLDANEYRYLRDLVKSDDAQKHQGLLHTLNEAYAEFLRDDSFTDNPFPDGYEDRDDL